MTSLVSRISRRTNRPLTRRARRPWLEALEHRALLTFGFGSALDIGTDYAQGIATDAAGDVFVSGGFGGSNLAEYVPSGSGLSQAWAQAISTSGGAVSPQAPVVDQAGNIYLAGTLHNNTPGGTASFNFGADTLSTTNSSDGFLAKYDASGVNQWAIRMGSGVGGSIAYFRDSGGHDLLYLAGQVWGTPGYGYGPGGTSLGVTVPGGHADPYLWKLDVTGATSTTLPASVWFDVADASAGNGGAGGVAIDTAGNAYVTGSFSGTVDFDPGPKTYALTSYSARGSSPSNDILIWKLNAAGSFVWAGQLGGPKSDGGAGIALDAAANVYITGTFDFGPNIGSDTNDFDPGKGKVQLPTYGQGDMFVAKYDSNMKYLWAVSMGGPNPEHASAPALDGSGNVYTTGLFSGTVDFDPGSGVHNLNSGTAGDSIFVSKLTSAGQYADAANCVMTIAGDEYSGPVGSDIALDGSGNVYTVGVYKAQMDFDPTSGTYLLTTPLDSQVPPHYVNDGFISRLTQSAGPFALAGGLQESQSAAAPAPISLRTQPGTELVELAVAAGQSDDAWPVPFAQHRSAKPGSPRLL